jgi:hypothetical protein
MQQQQQQKMQQQQQQQGYRQAEAEPAQGLARVRAPV